MQLPAQRFNRLLREPEAARLADDELHRTTTSLSDRTASHDTLSRLRAEIARTRVAYEDAAIDGRSEYRMSADS